MHNSMDIMEFKARTKPVSGAGDRIYQGLWKIEESFRVMKSNLEARPIFVWTESSIRGHFVMCYLALVIQRYLEYKLRKENLSCLPKRSKMLFEVLILLLLMMQKATAHII